MSAALLWKKKIVWAGIEAQYGVDPVLTAALSGVEVRNMSLTPLKTKTVDQNIEQSYLGAVKKLVVGEEVNLKFDIAIAGSGIAGVAPAWGMFMRGCKRGETVLAAAVTATAQAGAVGSITLDATASATDDVYRNMEIRATAGSGVGQTALIKSYNGTTKVATFYENVTTAFDVTTVYSIDAQTVYAPVDSGDDSLAFYIYLDRLKFLMLGARGNVVRTVDPLKLAVYTFSFTGLWGGYSDVVAMPSNTVFTAWKDPLAVNAKNTSGFSLHGLATNLYSYSVDDGCAVTHRDDIIGLEDVQIFDRATTGSVVIQHPLKAEYDFYAAALGTNGTPTEGSMKLTHGVAAGNIVKFYEPAVAVSDPMPENKNGISALKLTLSAKPIAPGRNESLIIVK